MTMLEKYRADVYRCAMCGQCRARYTETKRLVCPVREHTSGFEHYFARGRILIARGILEGALDYTPDLADVVYHCMTCGNCREVCGARNPVTGGWLIDTVAITEAMRADIVDLGLAMDPHKAMASSVEENNNPYKEAKEDRLKWANGMGIPSKAETMFFVGCTPAYRRQEMADCTAKILKEAGVEFGILEDEWCCGSPLQRTGFWDLAKKMAEHNVKAMKEAGAKKVVFPCAGCYRMFKVDYPKIVGDLPFEVQSMAEFIEELLDEGKIDLKNEVPGKMTYHDPCHLGRHAGVYDEPRDVLKAIPGLELVEMYPTRQYAWCCGGGAGVKAAFPDMAVEIAEDRLQHAKEKDAEAIVSACPFCKTNIQDAIDKTNSDLKMYDLTELVAKSMGV